MVWWIKVLTDVTVLPSPSVVQFRIPKKYTEVYINYKLIALLAQASY